MSEDISEKLDVLIRLQAAALISGIDSAKDKILFLARAGLKPKLIADILDTTPNQSKRYSRCSWCQSADDQPYVPQGHAEEEGWRRQ